MALGVSERKLRTAGRPAILGLTIGVAGIGVLVLLRAITAEQGPALPNIPQDLLTLSISVIIESLPFVVLGILLSIVVQVWIPDSWIMRALPRNPWGRRAVISFIGMFFPVCECGNVPLARGLVVKGFTVSESMTFLLAAPILNPVTIITTHQAFGFDDGILVARLVGGFVIANLIGWVFSQHPDQASLLTDTFAAECEVTAGDAAPVSRAQQSISLFTREAGIIMPALVVGSLLAGVVQVAVPRDVLVTLGTNPLWSILAMMVLAFVISVCSTVDAFFIMPFASIFLPGSIATFLLFGPIIDIKMLTLMRTTYTTRALIQITIIVGLVSAATGWAVNLYA